MSEGKVVYTIDCGVDMIGPECAVPLTTPLENLKEISRFAKSFKPWIKIL